jgi:hypothetical protein
MNASKLVKLAKVVVERQEWLAQNIASLRHAIGRARAARLEGRKEDRLYWLGAVDAWHGHVEKNLTMLADAKANYQSELDFVSIVKTAAIGSN